MIDAEYRICKQISFYAEEQIKIACWIAAAELVKDIDPNDIQYVAFAKHFNCKIWSGDKTLMNGLIKKGFHQVISTNDLHKLVDGHM